MSLKKYVLNFIAYKQWANDITYTAMFGLPEGEVSKKRMTNFKNMVHTLNHVFVVDSIFKAHLLGVAHPYVSRNTDETPALTDLWESQKEIDQWYLQYVEALPESALDDIVEFTFVDGGEGKMTRADMILHVVNHGTYHRGFVSDMMYQVPSRPPSNDYTVFLSDKAALRRD